MGRDGGRRPAPDPVLLVGVAAALAGAVLGPVLLGRGYVLSYDMVFVPDPPLSGRVLGLDGSVPRAVPSDLLVAVLSWLGPADLVQKGLLAGTLGLAAAGTARLALRTGAAGSAGAVVAAVVYVWSPFLAERLVLGHWALLLGWAALPWAVDAASRARQAAPGGLAAACAWTVPAAAGGGNAVVLLAPAVLAVLLWPGGPQAGVPPAPARRRALRAGGYAAFVAVVSLPWVVPAVLRPGGVPVDPAGVDAFAARADGPLGVAGSLVTLGGIWNAGVVPPERGQLLIALVTLAAVLAALAAGVPALLRRPEGAALVGAGCLGLALALLGAVPGGTQVVRAVVLHVPGGGVLRDGQKFLAPWVLLVALAAAVAAARAGDATRRWGLGPTVVGAVAVLPVALLPSLAWGAGGRLEPVAYPPAWERVRAVMDGDPRPGSVVVLPWGPYRRFEWNAGRVVLDPVQRITSRQVVLDDDLPLRDRRIAGEDPAARRVANLLESGGAVAGPLAALGHRFAVVHASAPGAQEVLRRLDLPCRVCEGDLLLFVLDAGAPADPQGAPRVAVLAAHGAAGAAAVTALGLAGAPGSRRRVVRGQPAEPAAPGPDPG